MYNTIQASNPESLTSFKYLPWLLTYVIEIDEPKWILRISNNNGIEEGVAVLLKNGVLRGE